MELEKREAEGDATSQNLVKVEAMADHAVVNDGASREAPPAGRSTSIQTLEGNSTAELGSVLHGYRESCGLAIELHEAQSRGHHRS